MRKWLAVSEFPFLRLLAAGALGLPWSEWAIAHHSFASIYDSGKAVTLTLVLTAKEAYEHLLDVSLFASPMADIPENPTDDPTKLVEWLGVVVTVEE